MRASKTPSASTNSSAKRWTLASFKRLPSDHENRCRTGSDSGDGWLHLFPTRGGSYTVTVGFAVAITDTITHTGYHAQAVHSRVGLDVPQGQQAPRRNQSPVPKPHLRPGRTNLDLRPQSLGKVLPSDQGPRRADGGYAWIRALPDAHAATTRSASADDSRSTGTR